MFSQVFLTCHFTYYTIKYVLYFKFENNTFFLFSFSVSWNLETTYKYVYCLLHPQVIFLSYVSLVKGNLSLLHKFSNQLSCSSLTAVYKHFDTNLWRTILVYEILDKIRRESAGVIILDQAVNCWLSNWSGSFNEWLICYHDNVPWFGLVLVHEEKQSLVASKVKR